LSEYERYVVKRPLSAAGCAGAQGLDATRRTYLCEELVPGVGHCLEMTWVHPDDQPGRLAVERIHDFDQAILCIGMDWHRPQELGATVEFYLGRQCVVFNTTTLVYIPRGTPYGPLTWREFERPYLELSLVFGSGEAGPGRMTGPACAGEVLAGAPELAAAAPPPCGPDFEQYVIRSPLREAGPTYVEGRQNPTMTYLSRVQIPQVNNYLEFGWIWDVPRPPIPKMRHDDFDEIVVHIGSDPERPGALGGVLEFGIGDELLELDATHCAFIPRLLDHGPLAWREVTRPHIEMAIMIGAGTLEEGWRNSFFDAPDGARRGPK